MSVGPLLKVNLLQNKTVTAATNVAVGQIVPVAYHKSRLADGTEIKKR